MRALLRTRRVTHTLPLILQEGVSRSLGIAEHGQSVVQFQAVLRHILHQVEEGRLGRRRWRGRLLVELLIEPLADNGVICHEQLNLALELALELARWAVAT